MFILYVNLNFIFIHALYEALSKVKKRGLIDLFPLHTFKDFPVLQNRGNMITTDNTQM